MDYSPPGCSFHGIFQASILGWVAISFSSGSSWPRDQNHVSCIGRGILHHQATREAFYIMISNYKRKLEPGQRMTAEVAGVTCKLRPEGSGVSHAVRTEQEASTPSQRMACAMAMKVGGAGRARGMNSSWCGWRWWRKTGGKWDCRNRGPDCREFCRSGWGIGIWI